jgi:predicted phage terminase large subunit-like protein
MDPKTGNPDDYLYISIPAEYDEQVVSPPELKKFYKDGLFAPLTFTPQVLNGYKKMGSLYYAGQYQQRPVPLEGNLFKRAWFEIISADLIQRDSIDSPIHFFIDTAYTEDQTERNDPSGILSVLVNFVEVWLEFPELIAFIQQYVVLNGYTPHSAIYVEPKASGKSVVQQLKGTNFNVIEIDAEWIRDDKVTRATGVSPIAQSGKVKIIEGTWNEKYLTQLASFPKTQHDEAVDTTVYALNYLMPISDFFAAFI